MAEESLGFWKRLGLAAKILRADEQKGDPIFPRGFAAGNWSDIFGRYLGWRYQGTEIDYATEVGDLQQSSLVMAVVQFIGTMLAEPQPQVLTFDKSDKGTPVPDHKLTQLMLQPNEIYDGASYMQVLALSYLIDGNNYWLKSREREFLTVKSMWYLPHFMIEPIWDRKDNKTLITAYRYRVDSDTIDYLPEDIVHIRRGVNPRNVRKGLGAFDSVLREIYGDNMRANFSGALLKNWGVVPFVISPKAPAAGEVSKGFGPNEDTVRKRAEQIKENFIRGTTGDERGKPIVNTIPLEITKLSFSPEQLDLKELVKVPESRVAAVTGVPAAVLQYLIGLENGTSYASYEQAREQGYESVVKPMLKVIESAINRHLLIDFPDSRGRKQKFQFDTSQVSVEQEDRDKLYKRQAEGVQGGYVRVSEARAAVGLPFVVTDEVYLRTNSLIAIPATPEAALALGPAPEPEPLDLDTVAGQLIAMRKEIRLIGAGNGNGHSHSKKKETTYDGMTLWREPTDLEKQIGLKAIQDEFETGEEKLRKELLDLREKLIKEAAAGIITLDPADFHTLTLDIPETVTANLFDDLLEIYERGRELVQAELTAQGATGLAAIGEAVEADLLALDTLSKVTGSRVANDVQARAVGAAATRSVLGETEATLQEGIETDLTEGSTAYIDTAAAEADHAALGMGRAAEADALGDIVASVYYSAILDEAVCEPCEDVDGETGDTEDDITPAPNPDCLGGARCRCIHVYVFSDES